MKAREERQAMQRHTLQVIVGNDKRQFTTEMVLNGLAPPPPSIRGRVLDITIEELLELNFGNDTGTVSVFVDDKPGRYKFERLQNDGTFVLQKVSG
jgi:hypothetical protein